MGVRPDTVHEPLGRRDIVAVPVGAGGVRAHSRRASGESEMRALVDRMP